MKTQREVDEYRSTHTSQETSNWLMEDLQITVNKSLTEPIISKILEVTEYALKAYTEKDHIKCCQITIETNKRIKDLNVELLHADLPDGMKQLYTMKLNKVALELARDILGVDFNKVPQKTGP